ncbi:MAG TPA: zinc-dependent metalloprotease [Candidatus Kapabacteria bacterium]|nr:zinc-dependent metalloprotease [Candidatus Kapabacteria bacterium]
MKLFVSFFVFILLSHSLFSEDKTIPLNSSEFFNFKKGSSQLTKLNKYPALLGSTKIRPISISKQYVNELINLASDKIKIKNFEIDAFNKFDLELNRDDNSVLRDTKVILHNKTLDSVFTLSKSVFYSGKIIGQANSNVFMSLINGNCYIYLKKDNGESYSISPIKDKVNELYLLTPHTLDYDDENALTYKCETDDFTGNHTEFEDLLYYQDKFQSGSFPLLEARIICEGAYDYFKMLGKDTNKVISHIGAVMLMTSKLYQENLNITFYVPEIHIRTIEDEDPYVATSNLSEKLQYMPNVWINHKTPRSLVVLFADMSNQPPNTIIAGISMGGTPYTGSVCNPSRGYCVLGITYDLKFPTINYTWDVNVAAHEIGHNFSAPHTHNCYWAPRMIDTCVTKTKPFPIGDACLSGNIFPVPGTIMSYCHTTNSTRSVQLFFHPRQIPLMRGAAENSKCIKSKTESFLSLLSPLGGEEFVGNTQLKVRWTQSKVNDVNIYFSTNNGVDWLKQNSTPISTNDSIFKLMLPKIRTKTALIRIEDASNPTINDQSVMNFSINYQEVAFISPRKNESYMQGEKITAKWEQAMNEDFTLEFTKDNGITWTEIAPTAKYAYVSPIIDFESDHCQFRLISKTNNTIILSEVFKIGKPKLKLIAPNGGERVGAKYWCFIRWESENINKIQFEYTINNGETWRKVVLGTYDALDSTFTWTVPTQYTDSAKVRIRTAVEPYEILDESDSVFTIYDVPSNIDDNLPEYTNASLSTIIQPNPAIDYIVINDEITDSANIQIYNIKGIEILEVKLSNKGNRIDISKLSSGIYFIKVNHKIERFVKQ